MHGPNGSENSLSAALTCTECILRSRCGIRHVDIHSPLLMKKLALLASLATGCLVPFAASADVVGGIDLSTISGPGTINYNLSSGQSNQFNVGATTNIGVSSNVSSTDAYAATAGGTLALGNGGGYDVQYTGSGAGAGTYDFGNGTYDGAAAGAGAGAVTVSWNGGSTSILQSIGNSASAGADAGGFENGSGANASANAAVGVVAGTFQSDANGGASAVVSGLGNKSNVFLGEGSEVSTNIAASGTTGAAGTSQTGSASSSSSVSTTANAATTTSSFTNGFVNVLGTLF